MPDRAVPETEAQRARRDREDLQVQPAAKGHPAQLDQLDQPEFREPQELEQLDLLGHLERQEHPEPLGFKELVVLGLLESTEHLEPPEPRGFKVRLELVQPGSAGLVGHLELQGSRQAFSTTTGHRWASLPLGNWGIITLR